MTYLLGFGLDGVDGVDGVDGPEGLGLGLPAGFGEDGVLGFVAIRFLLYTKKAATGDLTRLPPPHF
jgi:hypothetical protein